MIPVSMYEASIKVAGMDSGITFKTECTAASSRILEEQLLAFHLHPQIFCLTASAGSHHFRIAFAGEIEEFNNTEPPPLQKWPPSVRFDHRERAGILSFR